MANFREVAEQFTQFYYTTFDANRGNLGPLYRDNSMMSFESNQVQGVNKIIETLTGLAFQKVVHSIITLDAQPAGQNGSILVHVTGELKIDDNEHPQRYSQAFHLVPLEGTYFVLNDMFRLIYG